MTLVGTDMNKYTWTILVKFYIVIFAPAFSACTTIPVNLSANSSKVVNGVAINESSETPTFKEITTQLIQIENAARNSRPVQNVSDLVAPAKPYVIESGDVLAITVWDHPELNGSVPSVTASMRDSPSGTATPLGGFVVDNEGKIQYPYVGTLKLSGLTQDAARSELSNKLAHYIRKPNITLRVQSYRSKRVYVDGEVKQPGVYAIDDIPMTVIEAINRAGGMLLSADQSHITLNRNGESYIIDLAKIVQQSVNPVGILMQNGDVLRIQSHNESKVFISGEVITPSALTMHNGRLSLNEALGEAGGINPQSGDASQIYVVRRSTAEPVVYRLDARTPGALAMAESFELNPKDLIYVAATPLANWHRTISQIFPGALSSAINVVNPARR